MRKSHWIQHGSIMAFVVFVISSLAALAAVEPGSAQASPVGGIFRWRPFLGPFHSLVLHYPIGFLTMACILEIYRQRRPSEELRRVTTLVIVLSLLSGLLSAALGIMRAGSREYGGESLELHRWFGISVPLLTLLTLALHQRTSRQGGSRLRLHAYRAVLVCALVALVMAGHFGGNLTHGSKYLVQNAPEFVKELIEPQFIAEATDQPAHFDPRQQFYLDKIRPVLEAKCVRCHGPEKQKGGYRMDLAGAATKGGDSEKIALKPGKPMESNLVRLILLPRDDDDAMPPAGKEPLTAEEILNIVRWIHEGVTFVEPSAAASSAANASQ